MNIDVLVLLIYIAVIGLVFGTCDYTMRWILKKFFKVTEEELLAEEESLLDDGR